MKILLKFAIILAASTLSAALLSVPALAGDDSSATTAEADCPDGVRDVHVAVIGLYTDAALVLAENHGIFAKHCLNLELQRVPSTPAVVAAVSSGGAEVGYTTDVPFIRGFEAGLKLKVVAPVVAFHPNLDYPIEKVDSVHIYVSGDSPVGSAKDLEGKTVAVPALGAQGQVEVASDIAADGGDPSKVKWVALPFSTALSQLNAGNLDAATLVPPFNAQAEAAGNELLFGVGASLFPRGTTTSVYITSEQTAAEEEPLLRDFHASVIEANKYANNHPKQYLEALAKYTKVPLQEYIERDFKYYFPTKVTEAQFQRIAETMHELGYLDSVPDMSDAVLDLGK